LSTNKALHCAVGLLARREHSLAELQQKLVQKGHAEDDIQTALETCQRNDLQSDARFAESLCRTRIRQGYGPVRIRQELREKKIAPDIVDDVLQTDAHNWLALATDVWEKKYQSLQASSFAEKQKQRQFLQYRGFPMQVIVKVVV
jgi:regulatory protein